MLDDAFALQKKTRFFADPKFSICVMWQYLIGIVFIYIFYKAYKSFGGVHLDDESHDIHESMSFSSVAKVIPGATHCTPDPKSLNDEQIKYNKYFPNQNGHRTITIAFTSVLFNI